MKKKVVQIKCYFCKRHRVPKYMVRALLRARIKGREIKTFVMMCHARCTDGRRR